MLKQYFYNGKRYQFEEGKQPTGAVEVIMTQPVEQKAVEPEDKAVKPANKTRKAATK